MNSSSTSSPSRGFSGISFEKFSTTARADFRFAPINALILVVISLIGLIIHLNVYPFSYEAVALAVGSALCLAFLLRFAQIWEAVVILGTAETEIAEKFARASDHHRNNPVALHLRAMNMVFEGLRKKGSMIIVPSSAVETMGLGALGGLTSFGRTVDGGDMPGPEPAPEPDEPTPADPRA